MRRLATGMRVLVMDSRGTGMSDRIASGIDLETRVDDLGAVMDDAGVDRVVLLAWGFGGPPLAAFFAAVHPERTVALCIDPEVQMKRTEDWPFGFTAFVSGRIAGSTVVTTPGTEGVIWVDEPEPFVAAVESFLGLEHPAVGAERVLATILFTDIVGSTAAVVSMGDANWSALLAQHERQARADVARFRGRYIVSTDDGLLATFDGPARAVRCADAIGDGVRRLGVEIRCGCHLAKSSSASTTSAASRCTSQHEWPPLQTLVRCSCRAP